MPGYPDATELLGAVRDFVAGLPLEGRDAFHAKVAANVLAIVMREIAEEPDAVEAAVLLPLSSSPPMPGPNVTLSDLTLGLRVRGEDGYKEVDGSIAATVCARLRDGTLTLATPGLLDALVAATTARLTVDNPRYATLARLTAQLPPRG